MQTIGPLKDLKIESGDLLLWHRASPGFGVYNFPRRGVIYEASRDGSARASLPGEITQDCWDLRYCPHEFILLTSNKKPTVRFIEEVTKEGWKWR